MYVHHFSEKSTTVSKIWRVMTKNMRFKFHIRHLKRNLNRNIVKVQAGIAQSVQRLG
jgi:hypothetical protein